MNDNYEHVRKFYQAENMVGKPGTSQLDSNCRVSKALKSATFEAYSAANSTS